jgi:hypothetical protein
VSRPSTTRTPVSGVTTCDVQPDEGETSPSDDTDVSSARTTVVPAAITRPPFQRTKLTSRAVAGDTSNGSGYGSSPSSSDETPVCSVTGAISTPLAASSVTTGGVNGRLALGISALPGTRANTV